MTSNGAAIMSLYGSVWLDANRYYDAERRYRELLIIEARRRANPTYVSSKPPVQEFHTVIMKSGPHKDSKNITLSKGDFKIDPSLDYTTSSLLNKIEEVGGKLQEDPSVEAREYNLFTKMQGFEKNQEILKNQVAELASVLATTLSKLAECEKFMQICAVKHAVNTELNDKCRAYMNEHGNIQQNRSSVADDDDLDLFGSDEEDASAVKLREERLQAYASKKAKKPALVAKSSVVLDVKPWDDETDMKEVEEAVRAIQSDGLVWGASKLVPLAYGINKLQIVAIVEDDKVSIDWLQETINEITQLVQSVDVAAFNKL